MNKTSQYAYLRIDGYVDFLLDVVTERLGVQLTKTVKVGERVIPDHPINKRVDFWKTWLENELIERFFYKRSSMFKMKILIL